MSISLSSDSEKNSYEKDVANRITYEMDFNTHLVMLISITHVSIIAI